MRAKKIKTSTHLPNNQQTLQNHAQQNAKSETLEQAYIGFADWFNGYPSSTLEKLDTKTHWLYKKIVDVSRVYYHTIFEIEGMDKDVLRTFNDLKYDNGKVALVNFEGEVVPVAYKVMKEDVVGRVYEIECVHGKVDKLNGKVYEKDEFVIIRNNVNETPTIQLMLEQIEQIVSAKYDVDNNQQLTRPKVSVKGKASSQAWVDIKRFFESNESVIPIDNKNLSDINFDIIETEDRHEAKKSNFLFQMKVYAMFLGINVSDIASSSNEKTELEISDGMLFADLIHADMHKQIKEGFEESNKLLGTSFSIKELMEEEEEELRSNHIEDDVKEANKGEGNE